MATKTATSKTAARKQNEDVQAVVYRVVDKETREFKGYLIKSTSQATTWHRVEFVDGVMPHWTCDCKSYQYRSRCSHIDAAQSVIKARCQLPHEDEPLPSQKGALNGKAGFSLMR